MSLGPRGGVSAFIGGILKIDMGVPSMRTAVIQRERYGMTQIPSEATHARTARPFEWICADTTALPKAITDLEERANPFCCRPIRREHSASSDRVVSVLERPISWCERRLPPSSDSTAPSAATEKAR